jgi:hypothetical protein
LEITRTYSRVIHKALLRLAEEGLRRVPEERLRGADFLQQSYPVKGGCYLAEGEVIPLQVSVENEADDAGL